MPQRILQKSVDIDYSHDMAIVVLFPPDAYQQHEIIGIAQWVSDPTENGTAPQEIAFQVRDDWQGEGLGSFLCRKIFAIAKTLGVDRLKADVLSDNRYGN